MAYQALRLKGSSADVIREICELYVSAGSSVLDLTYGRGAFWRWDWQKHGILLETNDLYVGWDGAPEDQPHHRWDFTKLPDLAEWHRRDVVVFDPPFTAAGPPSDGVRDKERYGAERENGGPANAKGVMDLLWLGLHQACEVADKLVIVKTQSVVESGRLVDSEGIARGVLSTKQFAVIDVAYLLTTRRPQPDEARGAVVRHFRNRPSVFLIARRRR